MAMTMKSLTIVAACLASSASAAVDMAVRYTDNMIDGKYNHYPLLLHSRPFSGSQTPTYIVWNERLLILMDYSWQPGCFCCNLANRLCHDRKPVSSYQPDPGVYKPS